MNVWLLAFKLSEPGPSGNKYALAIQNTDPKDLGLSKTPLWEHSFPTIGAVKQFLVSRRVPVVISELELRLNEQKLYSLEISRESAVQMGFKL
jgi:hypothetical protein